MILQGILVFITLCSISVIDYLQMKKMELFQEMLVYTVVLALAVIGVVMTFIDAEIPNPIRFLTIWLSDWARWLHT